MNVPKLYTIQYPHIACTDNTFARTGDVSAVCSLYVRTNPTYLLHTTASLLQYFTAMLNCQEAKRQTEAY